MYAPVGLDEVESRLYEVLLAECVEYYVRIVRSLPVFEERTAGELLLRVRPRWRPRWRASRNACRTVRCSLFAVRTGRYGPVHGVPSYVPGTGQQGPWPPWRGPAPDRTSTAAASACGEPVRRAG
ncbi:hypothetical protein ACFY1C_28870 [Streptomyces sp. NPDC001279]|uniref:NACHT N-terminal Helical domain 1-containing protein n=1 Tax=Streptomyces sp. NPDC001279 TaxID=3364556 RepID=UPI003688A2FB